MEVKYDLIGVDYDQTRKADPFLTGKLLHHLQPDKEGLYLDIGCGTGNYTNEFHKRGFRFIGIDPSVKMLKKAENRNPKITWHLGAAEAIDLPDNSVDGIIGSLTIHHWNDLQKGFAELYRVMKPNGRIVVFTAMPKQMEGYWLNHYFPKMLSDSISQMPSYELVHTSMYKAGFDIIKNDAYSIKSDLEDKFLYCGKHNPMLYFDRKIRRGISSFSSLANENEVNEGLAKLRKDIADGTIKQIIDQYENELGDYLYVIGNKK